MFKRRLNEPFGKAGVAIGVVALVFAMLGGAYAATGGNGGKQTATASSKKKKSNAPLSGKQKKEVKKISQTEAKKFATAGPAGAAGATGPAGPAGKDGAAGLAGSAGETGPVGADGVSPEGVSFPGAKTGSGCPEGGVEFKGVNTTYACNGKKGADGAPGAAGSPWMAGGVLPPEQTETGVWTATSGPKESFGFHVALIAASFALPLEAALPEGNVQVNEEGFEGEAKSTPAEENCPGKVSAPKAAAGFLCVYTFHKEYTPPISASLTESFPTGVILQDLASATGENGFGSYAVTAPAAATP